MTCAEVTYDMRSNARGDPAWDAEVGDLLWNPKSGDGHVLIAEVACGTRHNGRLVNCGCLGYGKWPCPVKSLVCECGEDSSCRDHHYELLARAESLSTTP